MRDDNASLRSGGRLLVDQLALHGARYAFCVPGESYLDVLDALVDEPRIALFNARHEAGAANMAEAYGKLTGEPGIAMVTRGPGACHAAVGVHTAFQDSTPMILLIGQVRRDALDREAFQEVDYRRMFGPLAKWVAQIERTERIPEYLARAFRCATSGRPGPVVLALPEDMLIERSAAPDVTPYAKTRAHIGAASLAEVAAALRSADKPMLLLGGSGWYDEACRDIQVFAENNGLPTACSFRRQDIFDNGSAAYVGDFGTSTSPELVERLQEADLLLVVGARLGDMTTLGYTALTVPIARQRIVHVHPDVNEIGRVYAPEVAVVSDVAAFASAVAGKCWVDAGRWSDWRNSLRAEYEAASRPGPSTSQLDCALAIAELRAALPDNTIMTLDAGNHTGWPQRFFRFARPGRLLGPTSGAMGYSVPAAVAASLTTDRTVVCCVGDGGFMMSGQELATAVQHGGRPIVLLFNNGIYGTIRMHQEREYPGRVVGTTLVNPDFVALARAMGCHAERVECNAEFLPALARARASGRAALIELITDPDQVSTRMTITELRARGARSEIAGRPGARP